MGDRGNLTEDAAINPGGQKKPYQFSQEEMRVLTECNRESFYQRSLPFAAILSTMTYFGVKRGALKASPRFGAVPKILASTACGYFLGKLSYQRQCAEKLMQLPDSYVGEMLRKKRNKEPLPSGSGSGLGLYGAAAPDVYSDSRPQESQGSSLDLDMDRPTFQGLAENKKPNVDSGASPSEESLLPRSPGMSYDELRRKNRGEPAPNSVQPYKLDEPAPPVSRARVEQPARNKYGDIIN